MPLSDELRSILVCPQCKGILRYEQDPERLICEACGLAYAIEGEIPNMMIEEAERIRKA